MARKEVIQIRCSTQEKDKWTKAAADARLELSPWIRYHLDKAASQVVVTTTAELFPDPSEGRTWDDHD